MELLVDSKISGDLGGGIMILSEGCLTLTYRNNLIPMHSLVTNSIKISQICTRFYFYGVYRMISRLKQAISRQNINVHDIKA